jgi:pilus assembly protein FimV
MRTEPEQALAADAAGPQVRLVQSGADGAEVPGEAGTGSGEGSAEQGEGTAAGGTVSREALIRLEDDGLGLRLVGMDDLSSRMPALVALQDSAMAAGAVRDVVESADLEPVPSDDEAPVEEQIVDAAGPADAEAVTADETTTGAESDPAAASTETDEADAVTETETEAVAEAGDGAALAEAEDGAAVAEVSGEVAATDDPAAQEPAEAGASDSTAVADADQPSEAVEPKQGLELWMAKGKALFAEAKDQVQSLGFLNEPRTLAMVGGGLLLLLLLILLLIRRAVSPDAKRAPATAASALATPVAAAGTVAASAALSMDPLDQATRLMEDGEPNRAVSLLRGLMARGEDDAQVALKLLGAQMAAGDADGFAHDATAHRSLLEEAGHWDEVESMAQSVCPDHALFADTAEAHIEDVPPLPAETEPASETDIDTGADDEPESEDRGEQPQAEDDADARPVDQAEPVTAVSEAKSADVLEFSLAGRAEPRPEPETEAGSDEAEAVDGGALSFDLGDFRTTSDADVTETALIDAEADGDLEDVGVALEEEYAKLEAEGLTDILEPELGEAELLSTGEEAGGDDISFDAIPEHGLGADIEDEDDSFVDTKLDLATAYLEMGDDSGARSLYQEVLEEGNDDQKRQAMEGLSKLG